MLVGLALTLLVILADQCGGLIALERWAYDRRARTFQHFAPPPTDRLVHLDVDDRALDVIGRWPWPRAKIAEILDEVHRAGPKVVALDVIFSEPEDAEYRPIDPELGERGPMRKVDHDALLTESLRRGGDVILPVTLLAGEDPAKPIELAMREAYGRDLQLTDAELIEDLHRHGFRESELAEAVARQLPLAARRRAAYDLVAAAMDAREPPTFDALAGKLLNAPDGLPIDAWHSPLTRLLREAYTAARDARAAMRLAAPLPANGPRVLHVQGINSPPLARFAGAAAATAFVDHHFAGDPIVRSSPLALACGDRVFLQLGLAMACRTLDVDPAKVELHADHLTIPLANGQPIDIPVRTVPSAHSGSVPMVMDVPWAGSATWQTMYDWPNHREFRRHVSANKVWDVCLTRRKIETNNRTADAALAALLDDAAADHLALDPPAMARFLAGHPAPDDTAARQSLAAITLRSLDESGFEQAYADLAKAASLKDDERAKYDALRSAKAALRAALAQNEKLQRQLVEQRGELDLLFKGRAVLIGLTPSSSTADVVSTSLHDRCPGVVVHGAIFNAIMTRHFWRFAPAWVTALLTLALGALTAVATAWLPPARAMATAAMLLVGYVLLNGTLLFDRFGLIVGLAAPMVAVPLVWGACVLLRMAVETRERAMITRRFQAYVDPTLVDYVLEHPDQVQLQGQVKELTVVFTDLANFTTLSEALGERSVALLNEYMAEMVPIIRRYRGYVNKFLGDGIMCFYGAPRDNPDHALDAMRSALEMQAAVERFNAKHARGDLPPLNVRVGISTGPMVVGDAGSSDCSDYTVLGDAVNLGARLESANKHLGTNVLVTARTVELAGGAFGFRPVGLVRVAGKNEGVEVFEAVDPTEPLARAERRTQLTAEMIATYRRGDFLDSVMAAEALDREVGVTKLAALYRERAEAYLRYGGKPDDFDGSIALTAK